MLTHGSILCNCRGAYHLLKELGVGDEVFLCFLPLSHSYEHTVGQLFPISIGAQIYYAESVEKLSENMAEARPTIMTAVPRLYEAMHQRILRGIAKASPLQRRMFDMARRSGPQAMPRGIASASASAVGDLLAEVTVRRKVRRRFGGRLKAWVSGGAALNQEIGLFFLALGVPLLQGYGQTEASPVISANPPRRIKIATVGPALQGVEVKIAGDGEILVRSEAVMKGYWREEAATAAAIRDGWLHTGDIGSLDAEGYLQITDRKRDIIVLSGGDNVSPARVEGMLVLQPEINQAMVHGDRHPHIVALLVPDEEFAAAWAAARGQQATPRRAGRGQRLPPGPGRRRGPGQCRPLRHRAHPPLRHRRRALHHGERHDDGLPQDPPAQDPGALWRGAGGSLSVTCAGLPELLLQGICSCFCLLCLERWRGCRTCFYRESTGVLDSRGDGRLSIRGEARDARRSRDHRFNAIRKIRKSQSSRRIEI